MKTSEWKEMFRAWKATRPELSQKQIDRAARGCVGKIGHRNEELAKMVADIANLKKKPLSGMVGSYPCPVCAQWHIGHFSEDGYGPNGKIEEVPCEPASF